MKCIIIAYSLFLMFAMTHSLPAKNISNSDQVPLVVTTWANPGYPEATNAAWDTLQNGGNRVEALVTGTSTCERLQCDRLVGFGGAPDETGETTLDALVMDGPNHLMGAVADLRRIKDAARVAKAVMDYTKHSLLVGESATKFAIDMGFNATDLYSGRSLNEWKHWRARKCQPNYRQNVIPDPKSSCGPYRPSNVISTNSQVEYPHLLKSHDTIGMVVVDKNGDMSAGTSTNGAPQKVPGRVGDSPIAGAGAYVDNEVGAAACTGDGDIMMRFLPSYQTVESMRLGMDPNSACADAMRRIGKYYPQFQGAIVAANKQGSYGSSCHGLGNFSYCVRSRSSGNKHQTVTVPCVDAK